MARRNVPKSVGVTTVWGPNAAPGDHFVLTCERCDAGIYALLALSASLPLGCSSSERSGPL